MQQQIEQMSYQDCVEVSRVYDPNKDYTQIYFRILELKKGEANNNQYN